MVVTLNDIAEACGVSPSTVSRALSNPHEVSAATRERIQRIARELNYEPNHFARSLSKGRTNTIGLIVPDIANPFFPPIIKAVQNRAGQKHNAVLLADTDEHATDELLRARTMSNQVDGLILVSPRTPNERLTDFRTLGPLVCLNRDVPGVPSVSIETTAGVNQAVEHLAALRHRSVAYLNGPRQSWSNTQRRQSITAACAAYNVELIQFGPFEPQFHAGVRAADLVQASQATAVIAYDDMIALGVMARLTERGVRVGRDISVIGIDDALLASVSSPSLTSIHLPSEKAGAAAVDLLIDQVNKAPHDESDPAEPPVALESYLIVRDSTGYAPR